ncbi:disintegrin and metalloproteinase domain-containing protein 28 isoform X1 [Amblyraja radiata]|uniref:disintegrin and metalloproteinase domain-containing protein 28 isoform X1 n=1 Tax=Amblyraja radiata TaxID=386614 RepID=UPI0014039B57|nr:disintegrin and metalloproteinase domain-containing protein 28 isoform X1 [Amblyraja radiata]
MVDARSLLCSLLFCSILQEAVTSTTRLQGVQNYQVVKPRKLHAKQKRETEGLYPSVVQYEVPVEGKELVLHLEKNEGLFAKNYSESYTLENGTEVWETPVYPDHCYYHGYIKGEEDSSASFSTCDGLSGYIRTKGQRYLMEPLKETASDEHALYKYEELTMPQSMCGVVNTSWDSLEPRVEETFGSASERSDFLKAMKYIEMFVVADNAEFRHFGSVEAVRSRVFEAVNHINLLYRPLRTHVALVGLEIWSRQDKINVLKDSDQTLKNVLSWRNQHLRPKQGHDNIQFITYVDFNGDTIGLAQVAAMCTGGSGAVNQDHTSNVHGVASTMAHEMGHNLGMNHDNSACLCKSASCIMSPVLSASLPTEFSSCSHQNFQSFTLSHTASCMRDVPSLEEIVAAPICGNHFVEKGEDCDCGTAKECQNPCCEPRTCKLKEEAQCADGECCQDCKIKAAGEMCRRVRDECDLSENCDGTSNICPKDAFRLNGTPCKKGAGFCYNGGCPTHQEQCTSLWGPGARTAPRQCFQTNTGGSQYSYCKKTTTYRPCRDKDIMCGQLHCNGGNTRLPSLSTGTITIRSQVCKVVLDRDGVNPGLVHNGAKCGDNKMCVNAECVEVRLKNCSSKCPQHATCNHLEECQFMAGYSKHSSIFPLTVIVIIIVVVILIIAMIGVGCFIYWRRYKAKSPSLPRFQSTTFGLTNPTFAGSAPATPQMQRTHNPKGPMQVAPPPLPYARAPPPPAPAKGRMTTAAPPFPPYAKPPSAPFPPARPFPPQAPVKKPVLPPPSAKVLMPPTKARN